MTINRRKFAGAALTAVAAASESNPLKAQTAPALHRFDVASIRPSKAADPSNRLGPTPQGGLRGENVTVIQLIALAFGVRPFLIVDAPEWASTHRFDLIATPDVPEEMPANASAAERETLRNRIRQRIQALLTDRFGLVIRADKRPMPVYRLVVAKSGHKLTPSGDQEPRRMESNSRMLRGSSVDMKTVADSLTGILLRPVVDETNLSGAFNLNVQFADVPLQVTPETADAAADTAPTIFTAFPEQLGLRLEPGRAPTPVFVVEKIQRPSEN
jgi:uncharacterized protein (TIGR03435 family)